MEYKKQSPRYSIAAQRLIIIAAQNGNGKIFPRCSNTHTSEASLLSKVLPKTQATPRIGV